MTTEEKIKRIQAVIEQQSEDIQPYYDLLEKMGDMKYDYSIYKDFMFDDELSYLPLASYDQCAGLLTVILREDYFGDGFGKAFASRFYRGQVTAILERMIENLQKDKLQSSVDENIKNNEFASKRYERVRAALENLDDTFDNLIIRRNFLSKILKSYEYVIFKNGDIKSYILRSYPKFLNAMENLNQKISAAYNNSEYFVAMRNDCIKILKCSIMAVSAEAIVSPSNNKLIPNSNVSKAIFNYVGHELEEACKKIGHCKTGDAVITYGFHNSIIHAVGPIWNGGKNNESKLLYSTYSRSLELAMEEKCRSICFPLISTGAAQYPKDEAWRIAIQACRDFIENHPKYPMEIIFAIPDEDTWKLGNQILSEFVALEKVARAKQKRESGND